MPIIKLHTNLSEEIAASKIDSNFRAALIKLMADSLQKPVEGVALIVYSGKNACQLGLDESKMSVFMEVKIS
jgi:ABC-type metal ion transport system substrate-binding protein